MQRSGAVESGVGDVRDMNLWLDGGMERGHAQILPPPGVGKVPALETQIKSNIFNFWVKINLLNQSWRVLRWVRGVARENFHPHGVPCVFVRHVTPWVGGGGGSIRVDV